MKKTLINIRGASASGKTTCVKQFCERKGFNVDQLHTPFSNLPISIVDKGHIIILGDYSLSANCLGVDRYKNGKRDVMDGIMEAYSAYNPDIIIYEHMLSSGSCKGTKEIADVAALFGYEYLGIQLSLSDEARLKNLRTRSGDKAGLKSFYSAKRSVDRATEKLKEIGMRVEIIDVEQIVREDMWRIVDNAIRETLE